MMNYGMNTDYGNQVIDGLVIASKQLGWSFDRVFDYLEDISTVRNMHEANTEAVKRNVYNAVFGEVV